MAAASIPLAFFIRGYALYFEPGRYYNLRMLKCLVMRTTLLRCLGITMLPLGLLIACKDEPKQPPEAAKVQEPASAPAQKAENKPAQRRSSEQCVGPFVTEPKKTVKAGLREWALEGSTLTEKATDPDDTMVVGVIADLKEDTPENLANIDRFLAFFKQEKVEMIFVNGDTGETKAQVQNNLKRISTSGVPVGIIIGNRECMADFNQAVSEVAEKAQNVFNLNAVRHIVADDAEFITMPGYYNAAYLHCTTGCQYYVEDVAALAPLLEGAKHPITIVSHGPPRQSGQVAIDRISEGSNEGDPVLAKFIADHAIPFGIFANIHEAGGKATDLLGENVLREGIASEALYLNSGPGDSVRWTMNGGAESVGMAAVVTYKGNNASYKIVRASSHVAKKR
jgi:hypothetical protein